MRKVGLLIRYKAKLTGNSRIVTMEGREYLVYKVVILMEGVHHGSTGPILYLAKDMAKYAMAWNHKPVVLNHPRRNGFFVSADDPQVLSESKVGILMANRVIGKKQYAEAWLEKERAEEIIPGVLKRLRRGETVEVSTGLFSSLEMRKGRWKDEEFESIAREYRPDHLAILPNTTGACSVSDGCGLFTAAESGINKSYGGKKKRKKKKGTTMKKVTSNCSCKRGIAMTRKEKLVAKKLIGNMISGGHWTKKDRPFLEGIKDLGKLKKIAALGTPDDDDDDEEDSPRGNAKKKKAAPSKESSKDSSLPKGSRQVSKEGEDDKKKPVSNTLVRDTKKYLKKLPDQIRTLLTNGLKAHQAERDRLMDIILSNEENEFEQEELEGFEVPMLKKLASLAVANQDDDDDEDEDYSFLGASGAPRANRRKSKNDDDDEDNLPLPVWNYDGDEDKKKKDKE